MKDRVAMLAVAAVRSRLDLFSAAAAALAAVAGAATTTQSTTTTITSTTTTTTASHHGKREQCISAEMPSLAWRGLADPGPRTDGLLLARGMM